MLKRRMILSFLEKVTSFEILTFETFKGVSRVASASRSPLLPDHLPAKEASQTNILPVDPNNNRSADLATGRMHNVTCYQIYLCFMSLFTIRSTELATEPPTG